MFFITKSKGGRNKMSKGFKTLFAVITGRAVVILKQGENTADVVVGKELDKKFVVGSMVGAIKSLML